MYLRWWSGLREFYRQAMNWIKEKPYLIFFVSFLALLVFPVFDHDSSLKINIHDTYFVTTYAHICLILSPMMLLLGSGYWLVLFFKRKLNTILALLHLSTTFIGTALIILLNQFYKDSYLDYSFNNKLNIAILVIVGLIVLSQLLYLINLIQAIVISNKNNS